MAKKIGVRYLEVLESDYITGSDIFSDLPGFLVPLAPNQSCKLNIYIPFITETTPAFKLTSLSAPLFSVFSFSGFVTAPSGVGILGDTRTTITMEEFGFTAGGFGQHYILVQGVLKNGPINNVLRMQVRQEAASASEITFYKGATMEIVLFY